MRKILITIKYINGVGKINSRPGGSGRKGDTAQREVVRRNVVIAQREVRRNVVNRRDKKRTPGGVRYIYEYEQKMKMKIP